MLSVAATTLWRMVSTRWALLYSRVALINRMTRTRTVDSIVGASEGDWMEVPTYSMESPNESIGFKATTKSRKSSLRST
uniref:Uncharacterized protein n=1 Tax=Utricularia reniformis TaxID=192314 RepID=A0A1Y0B392_9LAMI|nr:hypothetical protein AEK19_MT1675 [Utricularia reniformis]ART31857.1 hypothetical protein AEK19_MT1675 [Utricularia reniformis]